MTFIKKMILKYKLIDAEGYEKIDLLYKYTNLVKH